jgi:predicted acyltransferase (DUF342 family)
MSNRAAPDLRAVRRITLAAALLAIPLPALAQSATDYAVFGRDSIQFDGTSTTVNGAPAASNGNLTITSSLGEYFSLRGGGNLTGGVETLHDVFFNGDVSFNALQSVGGILHSGGNINFQAGGFASVGGSVVATGNASLGSSAQLAGPVYAGGSIIVAGTGAQASAGLFAQQDIQLQQATDATAPVLAGRDLVLGTFSTILGDAASGRHADLGGSTEISGNLRSAGNVTMAAFSQVTGNVTHAGTLDKHSTATVGSSTQAPVTVSVPTLAPTAYVHASLPAATPFTSGGADITVESALDPLQLAPGSYGTLTFNDFADLELRSGNYYFDAIDTASEGGGMIDLRLDLTNGPINLFVTGDAEINWVQPLTVNGLNVSAGQEVDEALASLLTLESHGNIRFRGDFFGTLFAPEGDIAILSGISHITGQLLAQNIVTNSPATAGSLTVDFMPSQRLAVPEPAALLLLPAALTLLRRRLRGASHVGP